MTAKSSIVCVVPTIRPEQMEAFRKAWAPLFDRHNVTLITVWDGDKPDLEARDFTQASDPAYGPGKILVNMGINEEVWKSGLICRKTDAIRNIGFFTVASEYPDCQYILTLDDDVHPPAGSDPIQEHLDVLNRRVPISWMNTSLDTNPGGLDSLEDRDGRVVQKSMPYLRGFPYGIRDEAPVMVSHGVWVNVPDFDGRTQLELGKCSRCIGRGDHQVYCGACNGTGYNGSELPYSLPYFRGPVPRGTFFSVCGMNLMVRREALPYLYFAPMGPDSGYPELNRFSDIWMGLLLKRHCDAANWAIYTGASTVIHTRASDPFKNVEQEKLGIEWNEWAWEGELFIHGESGFIPSNDFKAYWRSYLDKAARFRDLIRKLQRTT